MNPHTPTDNTALRSRSWWEGKDRAELNKVAEANARDMSRKPEAKHCNGYTIGWSLPKSRRSL